MKFRLTILVFCSLLTAYSGGQNLEEVNARPVKKAKTLEETSVLQEVEVETDDTELEITSAQLRDESDKMVQSQREPKTYKKEEYLNFILRQIYYQKLTTNPWSKYLNKKAWEKNVLTWRYWSQLKDYIGGNDRGVIVIRTPEATNSEKILAVVTNDDNSIEDVSTDKDESENLETLDKDSVILNKEIVEEKIENDALKLQDEEKKEVATSIGQPEPIVRQPEVVNEPVKEKTSEVVATSNNLPQKPLNRSVENVDFATLKGRLPWPVQSGRITDRFGIRKNAAARGLRPENYGIDMYCPGGTYVQAVTSGTVLLAKRQSPYDFIVTIKHGDFTTAYYYLITPYVKTGDVVSPGQRIGQLRTSVAEADFHFEIWQNQDRVNPESWLQKR